jgi:FlaA1/EpsC-like NDP-sugar epimerase
VGFRAARFGSALGSNGSVTHEDVTRCFMTIPEAIQLVLQTSVLA